MHPKPVFRDRPTQQALIGCRPVLHWPLEIGDVFLGDLAGLCLILHADIDDAIGGLNVDRADILRAVGAEAAALDHRRAGHADIGILGGDDDVAAAEERGVACETGAGDDADQRHPSAQTRELGEVSAHQPGDGHPVGVARPAAAALCRKDHWEPPFFGDREDPFELLVVALPLGARQNHVVADGEGAARLFFAEHVAIDAADASENAVAGRIAAQVVERAALGLRRDRELSVFAERAVIADVGEVLAGGALVPLAALGDFLGAVDVEAIALPLAHFSEVRSNMVEINLFFGLGAGCRPSAFARFERKQRRAFKQRFARASKGGAQDSCTRRRDHMLHLHRFEHRDRIAGRDRRADLGIDRNNGRLQRRFNGDAAIGKIDVLRFRARSSGGRA